MIRNLILLAALVVPGLAPAEEVNVYTTRQPSLVAPVLEAFTAETGIEVNVAHITKGLVERLRAEGRRSPADLVMTVDIANLRQIVEAGVIEPVVTPALTEAVPDNLRGADGSWYALTTRARVVYASKERVADGEVTTYEDLASEKWRGRICTRPGTHNYNLALMAAMIVHHGPDFARDWAAGVKANLARRPQGNDRAQVKAIWAGECDISLGNTYYMGKMLEDAEQQEWANAVRIVFPVFEGGGTHVNVSGMALTRAAPHRAAAIRLMEFLVSEKAQEIYAEINYEYPVRPGTPISSLVASWGSFTPDTTDLDAIAAERPAALRIMEEVDFDG